MHGASGQPIVQYVFDSSEQILVPSTNSYPGRNLYRDLYPGAALSLSANGSNPGSGILWGAAPYSGEAYSSDLPTGALYAWDAENISGLLWFSQVTVQDQVGYYAKFVSPTIANGRVYVATFSNRLDVYGLFPPQLSASLSGGYVDDPQRDVT